MKTKRNSLTLTFINTFRRVVTPVIVKNHLFNFAKYNGVKFVKSDFLEPIDFDRLVVENLDR